METAAADLLTYCRLRGEESLAQRSEEQKKKNGLYLTPIPVAQRMAQFIAGQTASVSRILDPGMGAGMLSAAVIQRAIDLGQPCELWIDGFETDAVLYRAACEVLNRAAELAQPLGVSVHLNLKNTDFVAAGIHNIAAPLLPHFATLPPVRRTLLPQRDTQAAFLLPYNAILAAPPEVRLPPSDPKIKAAEGAVKGARNLFSLFLALAVRLLAADGKACVLAPRCFCCAPSYAAFRRDLLQRVTPDAVHLFETHNDPTHELPAEWVLLRLRPKAADEPLTQGDLEYSSSGLSPVYPLSAETGQETGGAEAASATFTAAETPDAAASGLVPGAAALSPLRCPPVQVLEKKHFIGRVGSDLTFRIPAGELDAPLLRIVDAWTGSLEKFGMEVTTGAAPVGVDPALRASTQAVAAGRAVPLIELDSVQQGALPWPSAAATDEDTARTALKINDTTQPWLTPVKNVVVLRRYSGEDPLLTAYEHKAPTPRRVTAAALLVDQFPYARLALDSRLLVLSRRRGELDPVEALGLAAVFNSALLHRFCRIAYGPLPLTPADLRALPLPSAQIIHAIGEKVNACQEMLQPVDPDRVVFDTLAEFSALPAELPLLRSSRSPTGKIQEAQALLRCLDLPEEQTGEVAALGLLALANLTERRPWRDAEAHVLPLKELRPWILEHYQREYAESLTDTLRYQALQPLVQVALAVLNPQHPGLPSNSPNTHYALSPEAVRLLHSFDTVNFNAALEQFKRSQSALKDVYRQQREQNLIPLQASNGALVYLPPDPNHALHAAVVNQFGPRFAPGAVLLYLADGDQAHLHVDPAELERLAIPLNPFDELPDVVFYDRQKERLYLVELVESPEHKTLHGPVSPMRFLELERIFQDCPVTRFYISVFPNLAVFKSHLHNIAWETDVWIQEVPDQLLHYNGDHFRSVE